MQINMDGSLASGPGAGNQLQTPDRQSKKMRYQGVPLTIGMPELGPYGLSENWLLRHFGDIHWRMICDCIGTRSADLADVDGNRLYASFVRVRWMSSLPLSSIGEGDELESETDVIRCGSAVYVSNSRLRAGPAAITMTLASIFVRRSQDGVNNQLLSAIPAAECSQAPDVELMPEFLREHRLMRQAKVMQVELLGRRLPAANEAGTFETIAYDINPYHDFNGANLLYFASYVTVADTCSSKVALFRERALRDRYVTGCSPLGRDLFMFANADMNERLLCDVRLVPSTDGVAQVIGIRRSSDGACISKQFCIREKLRC